MSSIPIQIIRREDNVLVDATLLTELTPKHLAETEKDWGPIRRSAARRLHRQGKFKDIPQHYHWDWEKKSQKLNLLAYRCCGIECDGKLQGLLMTNLTSMQARLEPDAGKPLVYIEYLESAPWNLRIISDPPLYAGIGAVLMRTAIELSFEEGFHGRIGLHALPQSEEFYRNDWKMYCCGSDRSYQGLPYYEMTREIAARFTSDSNEGAL